MSLNQPIRDLKKAESIPQGTAYVASMGDGSGVKAVTQEVLTKAVGEGLKIGNPEELQTENKKSLVGAINEVMKSGGNGGTVDILDTPEEVEANTELNKIAGAMALKKMFSALNDKLKGFEPVINEATGQITGYKTALGGADTVFPFRRNFKITINCSIGAITSEGSLAAVGTHNLVLTSKDGNITASSNTLDGSRTIYGNYFTPRFKINSISIELI